MIADSGFLICCFLPDRPAKVAGTTYGCAGLLLMLTAIYVDVRIKVDAARLTRRLQQQQWALVQSGELHHQASSTVPLLQAPELY